MRAFHRNGVYGVPFRVACVRDTLIVRFCDRPSLRIDLDDARELFKGKNLGRFKSVWGMISGWCCGKASVKSYTGHGSALLVAYKVSKTPFIGVYWGFDGVSPRFAAFALDLLPNVKFGENSWRGDDHCLALQSYIE